MHDLPQLLVSIKVMIEDWVVLFGFLLVIHW